MVGVIGHLPNPTIDECVDLAVAAEGANAAWVGLADAFWWRDVWIELAAVAAATSTIEIGPAMTNPYMRHPFHTASALATLGELAPARTFVGITAGGSEVTAAAHISRADAPDRVEQLADVIRAAAAGRPLDAGSGRGLDVPLGPVPILVAARGAAMLTAAGRVADRVLLWAIPSSDLERSVALVERGAAALGRSPELIWAPLVAHDPSLHDALMHVAVYASLNTRPQIRRAWGLGPDLVARIRAELVRGGTAAATALVPAAALDDLVVSDPRPATMAAMARSLGVSSIAVPGFSVDTVPGHVDWARQIEASLGS